MKELPNQKIIMFDSDALIDIAKAFLENKNEIVSFYEKLKQLVNQSKIKVVYTHIQIDQITCKDQKEIIGKFFKELKAELIPTGIAIYDYSCYDMCKYGDEIKHQLYEKLKAPESKESWIKDLILVLTSNDIDIFVVNDRGIHHAIKQIKNKYKQMICEVYTLKEFQNLLENTNTVIK